MDSQSESSKGDLSSPVRYDTDELSIYEYAAVLWRYKYLVIICTLIPVVISVVYNILQPASYEKTYIYKVSEWDLTEGNFGVITGMFFMMARHSKRIANILG